MTSAHLVAGARQEFGQRAHHVGQAAGLGVRKGLAAREQDFHHGAARDPVGFQNGRNAAGTLHAAVGLLIRFHQRHEKPRQGRAAAVEDVRKFVLARRPF